MYYFGTIFQCIQNQQYITVKIKLLFILYPPIERDVWNISDLETVQRLQFEQVVTSRIFEIDSFKRNIKIEKVHVSIGVIAVRYNIELMELNIVVSNIGYQSNYPIHLMSWCIW